MKPYRKIGVPHVVKLKRGGTQRIRGEFVSQQLVGLYTQTFKYVGS